MSRLDDFDTYIQNAMKSWHCPGVALSIIKEDDVIYERAFGLRDVEAGLELTPDTRFPVASITKSFTAMSVALLVDEGKLEWDKPVREYMPEFILKDNYATQHVTVRDMLSHRTGLPRHDWAAWRLDLPLEEFIKRMRHLEFSASFREKFQYNNLMYYASAYLVEKLSGQVWQDFVRERIFEPLGMSASNFVPDASELGQVNAKGYQVDRDENGEATGITEMALGEHTQLSPGAAGALFSTLADLTTWLKVHTNGGHIGEVQLVSPDTLKQMHLPQSVMATGGASEALHGTTIFTYGMGWFIQPYQGSTLIQHGGNVEGHSLIAGFVPQEGIGVVALTNIASLPLRDVLLYEAIDRTGEREAQDWNSKYHKLYDPLLAAEGKGKQTTAEEKLSDAPPSHPLTDYTGIYAVDGYPDLEIKSVGDGLEIDAGGGLKDWKTLRHYHNDVFEWHWIGFDVWVKIRFLNDNNGELNELSVPIETAVENLIYKRKALELPADLMDELIGTYDPGIEGVTYTVSVRRDKLYLNSTGAAAKELKTYSVSPELVKCKLESDRVEFSRSKDKATGITLKATFMTLEAPRVVES